MIYQNCSSAKKTFHGVEFNPGDIKEVNGTINDPKFIRRDELPKEPPKAVKKEPKPQEDVPVKPESKEEK